jgi:hypothetical protein
MNKNTVDINGILDRIIEETGIDQKQLSVHLGYNESYLSQARQKGTKKLYNILENYEREFRKSKNLNAHKPTQKLDSEDYKDKYIALLESHLETKKALERELETFRDSHKFMKEKLHILEQNQLVAASVQLAFQEFWLAYIYNNDSDKIASVQADIGKRAFESLMRMREEGIEQVADLVGNH